MCDVFEYMTNSFYYGQRLVSGGRRINLARRLAENDDVQGLMRGPYYSAISKKDYRSKEKFNRKLANLTRD